MNSMCTRVSRGAVQFRLTIDTKNVVGVPQVLVPIPEDTPDALRIQEELEGPYEHVSDLLFHMCELGFTDEEMRRAGLTWRLTQCEVCKQHFYSQCDGDCDTYCPECMGEGR